MNWLDWLKTLVLFFGILTAIAAGALFVYFTGICRLATLKFGRRMLLVLTSVSFLSFLGVTIAFAAVPAGSYSFYLSVPAALAGVAISLISVRCFRVMVRK